MGRWPAPTWFFEITFYTRSMRALWPAHACFLEIVLSVNVGVCVCVRPEGINNKSREVKGMHNDWIRQFYGLSVFYMTLAIVKLNGRGLSNIVFRERLPKKTKVMQY